MTDEQKLFSEFSPATKADWEQRAQKDLRDTTLDDLKQQTYEDIHIKPYFAKEDIAGLAQVNQQPGQFPYLRGAKTNSNAWQNIQQIYADGNGKPAIDKAADALQRGADGIHFFIDLPGLFDIVYLFDNIDLTKYSISYTLKENPATFLEKIYARLAKKHLSAGTLRGFVEFDSYTATGKLQHSTIREFVHMAELTKESPDFYILPVNGTSFSSIGASFTQEIAYTLNAAVGYLDQLTDEGIPLDLLLSKTQFYVAAGTNYFFEIAKLRVLRLLWAAVVEAYGANPELAAKLRIHSTTSTWFQTTLDPYTNMLRVTTEAMSAVIAGCDSISVAPFDTTFRQSDEFSERISRNVSIILKEEAYLDKAIDPAAGSYYLEALTNELADHAWKLFKEVESAGGFEAAYEAGFILGSITEISRRKFRNVATGKDVIVGTNKYPNPTEQLDFDPEQLIQSADFDTTRAAYPTEVMRMATELHLRKHKRKPKAVIATVGYADKLHLNALIAKELFACAGFEIETRQFDNAEQATTELLQATTVEVVVVSALEATLARDFWPVLNMHTSKPTIIMAEDPQHMKNEMIAHGYDAFLFDGCDTSAILELVHKRLHMDNEDSNGEV